MRQKSQTRQTGAARQSRTFQISAPIQKGNSGGPVLDAYGAVTGVVVSKLDAFRAIKITGDIPDGINFAIKKDILVSLLNSMEIDYQTSERNSPKKTTEAIAKLAIPAGMRVL
jgi:S1-C subfamily serine protease